MNINIPTILLLAVVAVASALFGAWAAIPLLALVFIIGSVAVAMLTATVCDDNALGRGSTAYQVAAVLVMNSMQASLSSNGRRDMAFLGASARETQLLERLRRSPAYSFLSLTVSVLGPVPVYPGYLVLTACGR